jgi:hypothetical protein
MIRHVYYAWKPGCERAYASPLEFQPHTQKALHNDGYEIVRVTFSVPRYDADLKTRGTIWTWYNWKAEELWLNQSRWAMLRLVVMVTGIAVAIWWGVRR